MALKHAGATGRGTRPFRRDLLRMVALAGIIGLDESAPEAIESYTVATSDGRRFQLGPDEVEPFLLGVNVAHHAATGEQLNIAGVLDELADQDETDRTRASLKRLGELQRRPGRR